MELGILEWHFIFFIVLFLTLPIIFGILLVKSKRFKELFRNPKESVFIDDALWEATPRDNQEDNQEEKESSD